MATDRVIAVGDIHGSLGKLQAMLRAVEWPRPDSTLLFLGDYIDRGPQSYETVEAVIDLLEGPQGDRVVCLMGNHERMFLDFLEGRAEINLQANGTAATVRDFTAPGRRLSARQLNFFRGLRLRFETESHIFVHAGLNPGRPLDAQDPDDLLWIREGFLGRDFDFGKTVVFGHTPFKEPYVAPGRLGLDTGAVYGGPLTAAVLPEGRFITVE